MPKWIKRIVLRLKLWNLDLRLEEEKQERELLLIDRWIALEEQDASLFDQLSNLHTASLRVAREIQTRRDNLASQLERL